VATTQTTAHAAAAPTSAGPAGTGGQFLTFTLGEEAFGVEILRVQEIKGYSAITPIPNAPPHVIGLMNLRGAVIPIIDLRRKFGMAPAQYTKFTVIIVVTVGPKVIGLMVDAVSDVLDLRADEIAPPPEFDASVDVSYLTGLGTSGEQLVTLLDVDRLVAFGASNDGAAAAGAGQADAAA
jgi:purine-binding chemotaxis protein CheW